MEDRKRKFIVFDSIDDTQVVFKEICSDVLKRKFQDVKKEFLPASDPNIEKIRFTELMEIIARAKIPFKIQLNYETGFTKEERDAIVAKSKHNTKDSSMGLREAAVHHHLANDKKIFESLTKEEPEQNGDQLPPTPQFT